MTRAKVLQASKDLALEGGPLQLTIQSVAKQAGISKGAVLYHFATKDKLLEALVAALFDEFDALVEEIAAIEKTSWLRAYLQASFPSQRAGYLRETNAIFAILALRPELRELGRERFQRWHQRAQEGGLDPVMAGLIRAAIDGLWYNEMFGFVLDEQQLRGLLAKIEEMLQR